jgi:Uma2 family endonuclease
MQTTATMTSAQFAEFARLPQNADKRLQLIDGEVFMAARPVPDHQRFGHDIANLIESLMPGGDVVEDINLHLAEGQDYEADVIWIAPGSACQETPTGFDGAPERVVEVLSSSTAHLDKGRKLDAYERHGVIEYWLADLAQMLIEVYRREGERFLRLGAFGPADTFESKALGKPVPLAAAFQRVKRAE